MKNRSAYDGETLRGYLINVMMRFIILAMLLAIAQSARAQMTLTEINPKQSSTHASDPDGASGGRVNGLARATDTIFFAASEWGGIFRSTDAGRTWTRMNGHRPTATWDVDVMPNDRNRVFATSFFDGRVNSLSGINVSTDGGLTWIRPPTSTPPNGFCFDASRRSELSAFGISIDPDNPQNVYAGTNCGLAVSNNGGNTWRYIDPTPGDPANDIWDVIVHHNGIIDLCGDDGHRRSINGGATWTTASANGTPLPSGRCSITASPHESNVLFAVSGTTILESDNGGGTWNTQFANRARQGRVPFVATNRRAGRNFDLWFGDVSLFRAPCTTPATPTAGGAARCPASNVWAGPFTRNVGAHDDMGDIIFSSQATDACPVLMSSDGGVYFNTLTTSPACHTPRWEQPTASPNGLWLFGMSGADRPGHADNEHLYFVNQDTGTFSTGNAGNAAPIWVNPDCCDGFDVVADVNQVVYTNCCFSGGRANQIFVRSAGMTGGRAIPNYPAGDVPGFTFVDSIDRFGTNSYVLLTTSGIFVTRNITASTISWTRLGAAPSPAGACGVWASGTAANPTFYVQTGDCSGSRAGRIFKFVGTSSTGSWQQVNPPGTGLGRGFGIFTVARNNPNRLFVSVITPTSVQMMRSNNGGATWANDTGLNNLMSGNGGFLIRNQRGPTNFTGFGGYAQPTLVAFDPNDANTLLAGAADSGIFLSRDGGTSWTVVTDNSGTAANPHVPRPRFAYFDRECGNFNIYIGTQGRGVWRLRYPDPQPPTGPPCQ